MLRELAGWAPKVAALARDADDTLVLFNNCYSDRSTPATRHPAESLTILPATSAPL
jgi:uncharacterized protein YecE (DUF72 family)